MPRQPERLLQPRDDSERRTRRDVGRPAPADSGHAIISSRPRLGELVAAGAQMSTASRRGVTPFVFMSFQQLPVSGGAERLSGLVATLETATPERTSSPQGGPRARKPPEAVPAHESSSAVRVKGIGSTDRAQAQAGQADSVRLG